MPNAVKNLTLLAAVIVLLLLVCEVAFRLVNGVSPFALTNFREARALKVNLNDWIRYDSRLGWVHRDNLSYDVFHTAEHGIRRNSPEQSKVRKGAILVSGSSFTAGSEVMDSESWPAQLEQILGRPVENAAVGNFALDQVIMRAEEMLPIVEPEAVVIDLMQASVQWVSYSSTGMPKPYFTVVDGKPIEHNIPVPRLLPDHLLPRADWLQSIGGYSLIVDRVMSTMDAKAWYGKAGTVARIQNDPIDVSCALLQGLKRKAEARNIRVVLASLYAAPTIMAAETPPQIVLRVENCARLMGVQVVSIFDRFRAIYGEDAKNLESVYGKYNNQLIHYTPRGNREVAMIVAEGLQAPPPKGVASDYQTTAFVPGDGRNLLVGSETLEDLVAGTLGASFRKSTKAAAGGVQEFQIASSGAGSEHFLGLKPVTIDRGPVTLSLEVRPEESEQFRVQLLISATSGVLADFDLRTAQSATITVGELEPQNVDARVVPMPGGWYRITVGGTLPAAAEVRVILQLKDEAGGTSFAANGEAMRLRRVQLERGQSASPYRPSTGKLNDAVSLQPNPSQ